MVKREAEVEQRTEVGGGGKMGKRGCLKEKKRRGGRKRGRR